MKACGNKRRFASREECEQSIRGGGAAVKLYSYRCEHCGDWHKTKHSPVHWESMMCGSARKQKAKA